MDRCGSIGRFLNCSVRLTARSDNPPGSMSLCDGTHRQSRNERELDKNVHDCDYNPPLPGCAARSVGCWPPAFNGATRNVKSETLLKKRVALSVPAVLPVIAVIA